jgi:hypothetical protein
LAAVDRYLDQPLLGTPESFGFTAAVGDDDGAANMAFYLGFWLAGQDSNLQPPDPKSSQKGYPQLSVAVHT